MNSGVDSNADFFPDRKSTRRNSSHRCISYAVFCLKKKKLGRHSEGVGDCDIRSQSGPLAPGSPVGRHPPALWRPIHSSLAGVLFFNDWPTPEISTLPLPEPLPP